MNILDFEKELQTIDKDLTIRPNNPPAKLLEHFPDIAKLASILYRGSEVCSIPNYDIYEEKNGSYGVDLRQDGRFIAHRTRPEALKMVAATLLRLKQDKEYYNDFFGLEGSSDAALRSKDEPTVEIVDEVSADIQEVQGGMIEGAK